MTDGVKGLIAAAVLLGTLGVGIGTMVRAFGLPGKGRSLFLEPVLPDAVPCPWTGHPEEISVSDAVIASNIDRMVGSFQREDHEAASLAVNAILRMRPGWAVMIHNQGLVAANQRQMGVAAERLAEAGKAYLDGGQTTGSALVRRHLSTIADANN